MRAPRGTCGRSCLAWAHAQSLHLDAAKPPASFLPVTRETPKPPWPWWFTWPPSPCSWTADTSSGWRGRGPPRPQPAFPPPAVPPPPINLIRLRWRPPPPPPPTQEPLCRRGQSPPGGAVSARVPVCPGLVSFRLHPPPPIRRNPASVMIPCVCPKKGLESMK